MSAVGVTTEGRGSRADEYLDAILALWRNPVEDFHGDHVRIEGRLAEAGASRRSWSAVALRRAAPGGDAW